MPSLTALLFFRLETLRFFCTFCLGNRSFCLLDSETFPLIKEQFLEDSKDAQLFFHFPSGLYFSFFVWFSDEVRTPDTDSIGLHTISSRRKKIERRRLCSGNSSVQDSVSLIVGVVNSQGVQLPGVYSLAFGPSPSSNLGYQLLYFSKDFVCSTDEQYYTSVNSQTGA